MQDVVRGDKPDVRETYQRGAVPVEAELGEEQRIDGPLFEEGEVIEMRGYEFRLQRINAHSLVFKPLPVDGIGRARDVIWEVTH